MAQKSGFTWLARLLLDTNGAARLRTIRIGGLVFIVVALIAGAYFWRTSNQVPLEDLQTQVGPNIDGPAEAPVRMWSRKHLLGS